MKKLFINFIFMLFITAGIVSYDVYNFFHTPIEIPKQNSIYHLKPGENFKQICFDLYHLNIISRPYYLWLFAKFQDPHIILKSGEYQFENKMTPLQILALIKSGKAIHYSLRIQEGTTFDQVITMLNLNPDIKHELYGLSPGAVMIRLGYPGKYPEGLFFPDTYFFDKNMTDTAFLKRAYQLMQKKLKIEWQNRAANLPYQSVYEALIVASLIEKETAADSERPIIADIILRRLAKKMRLQIDASVIYGLKDDYHGQLYRSDFKKDNEYNTYKHSGLPPTPIGMPSLASIHAALHPTSNPYFYYVVNQKGGHTFSENYQDHMRAVQIYRKVTYGK